MYRANCAFGALRLKSPRLVVKRAGDRRKHSGRGARDWLLARVTPEEGADNLAAGAGALRVQVFDRARRPGAADLIGGKLRALVGGVSARSAPGCHVEYGDFPATAGVHEAGVCVLGLICERLAAAARLSGHGASTPEDPCLAIESSSPSFARDVRRALVRVFAKLREEADASMNRDVYVYLASASACRGLLDLISLREPSAGGAAADAGQGAAEQDGFVFAARGLRASKMLIKSLGVWP